MLVSSSDSKYLLSVLLEQSYNGSLPSNEKRVMNTRTNETNSDSGERRYVHLKGHCSQNFTN